MTASGPAPHQDHPAAGATLTATFDLPLGARAASLARRATNDVLQLWGLGDTEIVFDALLVVSELVGNAVRHGADHVVLVLERTGPVLVVAVEDGSAVLPGARDLDPEAESGRGMRIVEAVARRWGVTEQPPGKRVWAELAWS